jgi:hypothetical protein
MNLNKRQQDWFFPAQKEAMKELEKVFTNLPCHFQMFNGENRIIEQFDGIKKDGSSDLVEVHYIRRENTTTIIVYKITSIQAWHKDDKVNC